MKPVTQTDWTAGSDRTAVALAAGAAARAFVRQPHIKSRLLVVFQRQDPQSCFRTRIRRPSTAPFQRRTVAHDRNTLAPKNKTGKTSLPICVTSAWLSDLVRRDSHLPSRLENSRPKGRLRLSQSQYRSSHAAHQRSGSLRHARRFMIRLVIARIRLIFTT